jgi:post-segregation antitoxin (ccd killing protein)
MAIMQYYDAATTTWIELDANDAKTVGGVNKAYLLDWANFTGKPSSTSANIDDAVSKRHTQNTDNTLTGSTPNTVNTTGAGNVVDFKVSGATKASVDTNGKYTGTVDWGNVNSKPSSSTANIDDAVSKKHTQNTDNTLTGAGANSINNTSTGNIVDFKTNGTIRASVDSAGKFTGTLDWGSVLSRPTSSVVNIDDAVTKRHTQNTDTMLTGAVTNVLNTTGTGNIVDFKVSGVTKASIDQTGKYFGTIDWGSINSRPSSSVADLDDAVNKKHSHTSSLANIEDAVSKRHPQNTDTRLTGAGVNSVNTTGAGNIVQFSVSDSVRSAIDATGRYTGTVDWSNVNSKPSSTAANIDDAVTKRHTQNTDTTLTGSGANTVNTTGAGNIVDFRVNGTSKSSIDTTGKYTGTVDWSNINSKPSSTAANIDDAVTKRHSQNTDTTLTGAGANTINNSTTGNIVDFKSGSVTKASVDANGKFTGSIDWSNVASKPSSSAANIDSAVTNSHTHGNKAVLDATTASFTGSIGWGSVTGKPATFPPDPHNQGASTITIVDSGNKTATTNVEDSLQELYGLVATARTYA